MPRSGRPGTYGYPDTRYPSQGGAYGSMPYRNGYNDGISKAQDTRDGDRYDPARHGGAQVRESRLQQPIQYARPMRAEYRDGFLDGYRRTYRGTGRDSSRLWPF